MTKILLYIQCEAPGNPTADSGFIAPQKKQRKISKFHTFSIMQFFWGGGGVAIDVPPPPSVARSVIYSVIFTFKSKHF
mgnify:FL=1